MRSEGGRGLLPTSPPPFPAVLFPAQCLEVISNCLAEHQMKIFRQMVSQPTPGGSQTSTLLMFLQSCVLNVD